MRAFHSDDELAVHLSEDEISFVLSSSPDGAFIESSRYFDNYDLPCPVKVEVCEPSGQSKIVVLRKTRHGDLTLEAEVETTLSEIGLSVPAILAGPKSGALVVSYLPGEDLQHFSMRSAAHVQKAMSLLLDALQTLERLTDKVESTSLAGQLPKRTLIAELEAISQSAPWAVNSTCESALADLRPVIREIDTPLTFTNGDYQPANFLTDGEVVTGFLDFEDACFRDPLMSIAKYPVYDLHPFNKAGFVDLYLRTGGFKSADFAPRLALVCLATLQREAPAPGESNAQDRYRTHLLQLLDEAMAEIKRNGLNADRPPTSILR
ncbi:MAG: phosphotransferase [Gemmatimonadetes bacterium]|jgi:aminoglycoside phosphotransferase|nr:phosphotransferase [Gemmatimonadota bacterium]